MLCKRSGVFGEDTRSTSVSIFLGILLLSVFMVSSYSFVGIGFAENEWWNAQWSYRKSLTINGTNVDGDFSNFPVLINITDVDLASKAQSDADDIVFADVNGTKLSHEIEFYDSVTGRLVSWVRIPSIFSSSDTIIYMYYGNSQASNQEDTVNVWDSNYVMVQHLNEESGVHYDSTAYDNDGTNINGVNQSAVGIIDGADNFNDTSDYINVTHSDTLAGFTEAFTVSSWVKLNEVWRRQTILCKYNTAGDQRAWYIGVYNITLHYLELFASDNGTSFVNWRWEANLTTTDWHYITVVWESDVIASLYLDGVELSTWGSSTISSIYANDAPLHIGQHTVTADRWVNGTIDEVRVSKIARSAEWIATEYRNQENSSAFYNIGTEEQVVPFYIVASSGPNGSIDPDGSVVVAEGLNQTFYITPDNGYQISDVIVNGTSVGAVSEYTFTNVTMNNTIEAQFAVNTPPTIQTSKTAYDRGQKVLITVTEGTADGIIMIQLHGPSGKKWANQSYFASDGSINYQLKIPPDWSYGIYTITVRDFSAWTTKTKTFTIKDLSPSPSPGPAPAPPNLKPVSRAGGDQRIFVGHTLYFDGSDSTDSDGTISVYLWKFGDGSTATEVTTSHAYSTAGVYVVELSVVDNRGASDTDTLNVTVEELPLEAESSIDEGVQADEVDYLIDATDVANTTVRINTTELVTVTVIKYPGNPHPDVPLPPNSLPPIVDIAVSNPDAVSWPIYVERHYSEADIVGLNETRLVLYYFKDGVWRVCRETGVYTDLNLVWANMYEDEVTGSPVAIGELPIPASFVLSDLTVNPTKIEPGESVTVSVKVVNVGEESGSHNVSLLIEGMLEELQTVVLDGGNQTTIQFSFTRDTEGSYSIEVDGLESSFTVEIPSPAEFEVSNLVVTPTEIELGDEIEISVKVINGGMLSGSYTIHVRINGVEVDSETITLNGGDSTTVTFTVTPEEEEDFTVDVNGLSETVKVRVPATPAEFEYRMMDITPKIVEPGDMVTVDVRVSNIGEESGTYSFDLTLDGEVVDTSSDELDGGETTLVSLSVSSETEGSHEVGVNGETDSFTVEAPTPSPSKLPWIWIDLAIVVVVVAVVYVLRKRNII